MFLDMPRNLKPRAGKEGKARVGYELDAHLMHQLRILAAELDENQSVVLENAIREYLQKYGKPVSPTKSQRS
ncbi:MAG TPA: hypothetical protein PKA61_03135 [Nitrospira sp.]|nr:hypothetical protein [Nitrospira sp.]